jgi:hypothetical protein
MKRKAFFGDSAWFDGMRPNDIAPKVFDLLKKKTTVIMAMENYFWVSQINTQQGLSEEHVIQFTKL